MKSGNVVNIDKAAGCFGRALTVIGCDPSLAGWGLARLLVNIDSLSTLKPEVEVTDLLLIATERAALKSVRAASDDLRRAQELHDGLHSFCRGAALLMAEIPSGTQSARGAMSNGICLGVLASSPLPIIQVAPLETKTATVGTRTATKAEMIGWATTTFPDAPWLRQRGRIIAANEHLADAVAVGLAGLRTPEFRVAVSMTMGLASARA